MKTLVSRSLIMILSMISIRYQTAQATDYFSENLIYAGPSGGPKTIEANQHIFSKYCTGKALSTEYSYPNFSNPDVKQASEALSTVRDVSFYFYPPMLYFYKLGTKEKWIDVPATAPKNLGKGGYVFLVGLCNEFRDRASMISEKINWLKRLYKLPIAEQQPIDLKKNIWSQFSAYSYPVFISFTEAVWQRHQAQVKANSGLTFDINSKHLGIDRPVPPISICETKFILQEYISNPHYTSEEGRKKLRSEVIAKLSDLSFDYDQKLAVFTNTKCTKDDQAYFYDFRGDKNFKHNSPESNGMIWAGNSYAANCVNPNKAKSNNDKITDRDCSNYFKTPFISRWTAARAGLTTWLFRDTKYDDVFKNPQTKVTIFQHLNYLTSPFGFSLSAENGVLKDFIPEWSVKQGVYYARPDLGFNELVSQGTSKYDAGLAYERLRDAVNRHTNWYQSAFDDGMGFKMDQVYSPFVASSHIMNASNGFATGSDGRKAWMFIFKVKFANVRDSKTTAEGLPVNFDTNWFDETSLGTAAGTYAKSERAMDRLGTAIEGEFDSILYLRHIQGDKINPDCPTDQTGKVLADPNNPSCEVEAITPKK